MCITEVSDVGKDLPLLARDTHAAIRSGCLHATAALVDRVVTQTAMHQKEGLACIVTGGNAKNLLPLLTTDCHHVDGLVLQGLVYMAKEME